MYILMNEKYEFLYHDPKGYEWTKEFSKGCWFDDIGIPEKIMQYFARIGEKTYLVEFNVIDWVIDGGKK